MNQRSSLTASPTQALNYPLANSSNGYNTGSLKGLVAAVNHQIPGIRSPVQKDVRDIEDRLPTFLPSFQSGITPTKPRVLGKNSFPIASIASQPSLTPFSDAHSENVVNQVRRVSLPPEKSDFSLDSLCSTPPPTIPSPIVGSIESPTSTSRSSSNLSMNVTFQDYLSLKKLFNQSIQDIQELTENLKIQSKIVLT